MKRSKKAGSLLLSLMITIAGISQPSFIRDSLDGYISRGIRDAKIPGLAISIIKDGKIVVMKGYGVREVGKSDLVDENTLFMIASNSKLFTASSLAKLEQEKKLSLDDKISKFFPWYTVYDENVSKMVTIRDLLSHRLGTKTFQGDFTFWNSNLTRKDIITRMRLLKPTGSFRQDYGYCNSCFLTAGEIIPVVTGTAWENYIQENILTPLEMTNTYPLTEGMEKRANAAVPYTNTFGELTRLPYDRIDNLAPAGSIVSNVKDVSKWLMMQLDSGKYHGKQVIPWNALLRTRDMNTITGTRKSGVYPTHFRGYGLGLFINDYNGRAVYWHTGGADGFVTNTCFVPQERLAITVMTNNDNQNFFEALRYQILDAYLGVPYTDRAAFQAGFVKQGMEETQSEIKKMHDRTGKNMVPANLNFEGKYTNELYGNIEISKETNGLYNIKFEHHPFLTASMHYMDNNEFMTNYSPIAYGIFPTKFKIENGKVVSVEIKTNDFIEFDPYVFIKN